MSDESTPGGREGAVSVRVTRDGWRAHVPIALFALVVYVLGQAFGWSSSSRIESKLDDLATRVARIEGSLGPRVSMRGSEGSGGVPEMNQ